jgi:hypothetical protein
VSRLEAASLISFKKNSEKKSGNFFLKNFQTIVIYFFNWIVNKKKQTQSIFLKIFKKFPLKHTIRLRSGVIGLPELHSKNPYGFFL